MFFLGDFFFKQFFKRKLEARGKVGIFQFVSMTCFYTVLLLAAIRRGVKKTCKDRPYLKIGTTC